MGVTQYHSTHMSRFTWIALSLMMAACTSRVAPIATSVPTRPTPTVAPAPRALEPTACRSSLTSSIAQCYDLIVPEFHTGSNTRTLRLHVAVYKSTAADRVEDPILFLMGGPGAPGIASYGWSAESFPPFHGRRDVVVLDQRGTGDSVPKLTCPEYGKFYVEDAAKQRSGAESLQLELAAYRDCYDRLVSEGVDPSAYTSAEIAADVEDLRRALNVDQWNLFGWSYGTRIALTLMRDFPTSVRSAVLDSPYPPPANQLAEWPRILQATLQRLFNRCAANVECDKAYPQLEHVFYQLLEELDAHPVQVGNTLVTSDRFIDVVFSMFFDWHDILELPRLIYDTRNGDNTQLSTRARNVFSADDSFADGLQASVLCAEEIPFDTPKAMKAGAAGMNPRLVEYFAADARSYSGLCGFWKTRAATAQETAPVVSNTPTLLLVGDVDPLTPPEWARLAASTLSRAQVVEFPWLGHGVFRADFITHNCAGELVGKFLDQPAAALDMRCVDAYRALPHDFVLP